MTPSFTKQTIKEDGTQQISLEVGTYLMTELAKLRDKYEIVGDVRGKGLQIGVEMVKDKVWSSISAHMLVQCVSVLAPGAGSGGAPVKH